MSEPVKDGEVVLCGANSYEEKYYFNPQFEKLPEVIKEELQMLLVSFTEDVGGIILLKFSKEGELEIVTDADEMDYLYDEIGSGLRVRQIQKEQQELLESLELFYHYFIQHKKVSKELAEHMAKYDREEDPEETGKVNPDSIEESSLEERPDSENGFDIYLDPDEDQESDS